MIYALCAALALLLIFLVYIMRILKARISTQERIIDDLVDDRVAWSERAAAAICEKKELAAKLKALQEQQAEKQEVIITGTPIRYTYGYYEYGAPISIAAPTCSVKYSYATFEEVKAAAMKVLSEEVEVSQKRMRHLESSNTYAEYAKGAS